MSPAPGQRSVWIGEGPCPRHGADFIDEWENEVGEGRPDEGRAKLAAVPDSPTPDRAEGKRDADERRLCPHNPKLIAGTCDVCLIDAAGGGVAMCEGLEEPTLAEHQRDKAETRISRLEQVNGDLYRQLTSAVYSRDALLEQLRHIRATADGARGTKRSLRDEVKYLADQALTNSGEQG